MSSTPEMPVQPGDVLAGKYRVERVLGHGGMGVVVAATQLDLGRLVALKFLLHGMSQADVIARFLREARIVGGLRSEHVARVYELGQLENGAHYMAMEYLDGADFAALLAQRGALHFAEAAAIVRQACEAIAEAHQAGVIHRDLKPANLFRTLRPNGAQLIKVLDFGISKSSTASAAEQSMTRTSALMGSPYYMSPEQMAKPKTVDLRTDIWSLGVILHELVTGKVPFQGETLAELALNVHHEEPPPIASLRPDVPAAYQTVVSRCLQKNRELRYGSIRELSDALAECEDSSLPAGPATFAPHDGAMATHPGALATRVAFGSAATAAAPADTAVEPSKTGNWGGTIVRARRSGRVFVTVGLVLGVVALGATAALLIERSGGVATVAPDAGDRVAAHAPGTVEPLPARAATSAATESGAGPSASDSAPSPAAGNPTPAAGNLPPDVSPAAATTAQSSLVAASGAPPRRVPSSRKARSMDSRPASSASTKPGASDVVRPNSRPAGWDDEILKP